MTWESSASLQSSSRPAWRLGPTLRAPPCDMRTRSDGKIKRDHNFETFTDIKMESLPVIRKFPNYTMNDGERFHTPNS